MNREDIDRLAREAGIVDVTSCKWTAHTDDLERFATLVAAAEREACAKVCDALEAKLYPTLCDDARIARSLAAAIRSRGEVKP